MTEFDYGPLFYFSVIFWLIFQFCLVIWMLNNHPSTWKYNLIEKLFPRIGSRKYAGNLEHENQAQINQV